MKRFNIHLPSSIKKTLNVIIRQVFPAGQDQGLLQLLAWVCLGFYKCAADFYELFIHKMCILEAEKKLISEEYELIN